MIAYAARGELCGDKQEKSGSRESPFTRILPDGKVQELGQSFNRPGVGILADGDDAVLVIDNGASVVRRVSFDGQSSVVVDGLSGSAVALGRAANGDLLVGTWGSGNIYRVAWPKS